MVNGITCFDSWLGVCSDWKRLLWTYTHFYSALRKNIICSTYFFKNICMYPFLLIFTEILRLLKSRTIRCVHTIISYADLEKKSYFPWYFLKIWQIALGQGMRGSIDKSVSCSSENYLDAKLFIILFYMLTFSAFSLWQMDKKQSKLAIDLHVNRSPHMIISWILFMVSCVVAVGCLPWR